METPIGPSLLFAVTASTWFTFAGLGQDIMAPEEFQLPRAD